MTIEVSRDGRAVARDLGEAAPAAPPFESAPSATFDDSRERIWHLGYLEGRPRLALLDSQSLDVLVELASPHLRAWGGDTETATTGSTEGPIIEWGNAGNSAAELALFELRDARVVEVSGSHLLEAADDVTDERIIGALRPAPDRVLVQGDASDVHALAWPTGEPTGRLSACGVRAR